MIMGSPQKYPPALIERGVRTVLETGRPIAQVARDLGMHGRRCGLGAAGGGRSGPAGRSCCRAMSGRSWRGCGRRTRSCGGRTRSSKRPACISRRSSTRSGEGDAAHRAVARSRFGVEPICRVLGVPASTYYARRSRTAVGAGAARRRAGAGHRAPPGGFRRVYGVRKTWHELRRRGVDVGRDRVARLMRQQGLEACRRGRRPRTTIADAAAERARDLVRPRLHGRPRPTSCGSPTSPTCATYGGSSTWPSSWTSTAG